MIPPRGLNLRDRVSQGQTHRRGPSTMRDSRESGRQGARSVAKPKVSQDRLQAVGLGGGRPLRLRSIGREFRFLRREAFGPGAFRIPRIGSLRRASSPRAWWQRLPDHLSHRSANPISSRGQVPLWLCLQHGYGNSGNVSRESVELARQRTRRVPRPRKVSVSTGTRATRRVGHLSARVSILGIKLPCD